MSALPPKADIAARHLRTKWGSVRRLTRLTSSSTSVPRLPTPYACQPGVLFERQAGRTVIVGHFHEARRRYKAAPNRDTCRNARRSKRGFELNSTPPGFRHARSSSNTRDNS